MNSSKFAIRFDLIPKYCQFQTSFLPVACIIGMPVLLHEYLQEFFKYLDQGEEVWDNR